MKAIQVVKAYDMQLIEKEIPKIKKNNEVLVKVMATGICGSDVHIYHGTSPVATYPRVIGHEVVGQIVEIGSAVSKLKIGDRVIMEPIEYCGKCYACKLGRGNVCQNLKVIGVHEDGGFQEYICLPEKLLHIIPDEVSYIQAVMIEPYTIGCQASWRAGVLEGDIVLIYGAGPVGLIVLDTVKNLGATCIISDINDQRLAFAKEFGADYTLNPLRDQVEEKVRELTGGMGANVVFDAVGIPSIFANALKIASVAGRVVSMAFTDEPTPISMLEITKKELNVVGTRHQTKKFKEVIMDFPSRIDKIDKLITHVFNFEEYEKAFELSDDKNSGAGKIVLTYY
ncbi:MAG: alcohol dehydrogenase [Firmicutes bacterium HGW-Firmicutes-7]|nr:MAG: alcohol dehydrogenase [Firmicutes bacterium HGW-Firmicutes-7]